MAKKTFRMKEIATIILAGGQGSRLFPLTMSRCKPAMCYGGRYRLIDIPISNAINSGCQNIYVITQFLSHSLHQHIMSTYRLGSFFPGFIDLLSVEEKPEKKTWLKGTADAVRQNLDHLSQNRADYFLILSGDQLYQMDFSPMVELAIESNADVVVASLPVSKTVADRMGILQIDEEHFITSFIEKPQKEGELDKMELSPKQMERLGIKASKKPTFLGSMGIYLFKRKALFDLLKNKLHDDFGKDIIPAKVEKGNIATYIHQGYWEDIGTIESYYQANMALNSVRPPLDCYDERWPIFAHETTLPGARIFKTLIDRAIICEGSYVEAQEVSHSILGPRTYVEKDTVIRNSYIMGNDFFSSPQTAHLHSTQPCIGKGCIIDKALIDKHVCIGDHVQLVNKHNLSHYDGDQIYIRDKIIVVPRGVTLPDGFIL